MAERGKDGVPGRTHPQLEWPSGSGKPHHFDRMFLSHFECREKSYKPGQELPWLEQDFPWRWNLPRQNDYH